MRMKIKDKVKVGYPMQHNNHTPTLKHHDRMKYYVQIDPASFHKQEKKSAS